MRLMTGAAKRYRNLTNSTALIWKVLMVVAKHFRKLSASHLMAEVYMGVKYVDCKRLTNLCLEGRVA
jgi:hypothetical protein